jgi:hypothetical protein
MSRRNLKKQTPSFVPQLIFAMACSALVIPTVDCGGGGGVGGQGVAQGGFAGVGAGGFTSTGVAMGGFTGVGAGGFTGVAMGGFGGTSSNGGSSAGGSNAGGSLTGGGGIFAVAQMGFSDAKPRPRAKKRRAP